VIMKAKIFVFFGDCRGYSVDNVRCQCYHGMDGFVLVSRGVYGG
jgi:hypothetical protein